MDVKVYIVTEVVCGCGGERLVDAKLTFEAARSVAKLAGNRRVTRVVANKEPADDIAEQHEGEQHGD